MCVNACHNNYIQNNTYKSMVKMLKLVELVTVADEKRVDIREAVIYVLAEFVR